MSKRKAWVRIKLVQGQWYAFGSGLKRTRNQLLVPAINFCKKLNTAKAHL